MSFVEIKDFNAFIDNKPFYDQSVKNKQKEYEKLMEMSRNNDYTTGTLFKKSPNTDIWTLFTQWKFIRLFVSSKLL